MIDIDEIYQTLAENILEQIDEEWLKAQVDVEYFGNAANFDGSSEEIDIDTEFKFFKLFKSLHEITTENDSNSWNRAKFTLTPDGSFSIDFSWNQELADEIERFS